MRIALTLLIVLLLSVACAAHSVVYEDATGHPLFRLKIPDGWAVNLDGDRISIFPENSSAFIGAWFLNESFSAGKGSEDYIRSLCEAYFVEHELHAPQQVGLDGGLEGTLYPGRVRRDEEWGQFRALIFRPCPDRICFAIQYTPANVKEVPPMHESVIQRVHK